MDLAWVRAQTPENLSATTVVLVCDGPLDPVCVKSRIEDRLLPEVRLRQRIEHSHLPLARPRWRNHDQFRLSDHFHPAEVTGEAPPATLAGFIGQLSMEALEEDLPLWQVYLLDHNGKGSALILRLHAAVADSMAAAALAVRLIDNGDPVPSTQLGLEHRTPLGSLGEDTGDPAAATRRLCRLITSRADRRNPFRRQPTGTKNVDWITTAGLETQHPNGSQVALTTEALLSAVVDSLRRETHRQDVPAEGLDLRAVVSLNLRQPGDPLVGTRAALGILRLPLPATSPEARLEALRQQLPFPGHPGRTCPGAAALRTICLRDPLVACPQRSDGSGNLGDLVRRTGDLRRVL